MESGGKAIWCNINTTCGGIYTTLLGFSSRCQTGTETPAEAGEQCALIEENGDADGPPGLVFKQ